jgi:hypothetical protein
MKNKLLILISFLATSAFAGADDSVIYRHEFGINATGFIQQFVALGNVQVLNMAPYDFFYKYHYKKNSAFRAGAGLGVKNSFTTDVNRYTQRYDLRLGIEKSRNLVKKFYGYAGFDISGSYSYDKVRQNIFSTGTVTTVTRAGIGPVLGIEYRLNPRIRFSAEASAKYTYHITVDKFETPFPPAPPEFVETTQTLELLKPIYIFVSINF